MDGDTGCSDANGHGNEDWRQARAGAGAAAGAGHEDSVNRRQEPYEVEVMGLGLQGLRERMRRRLVYV